VLFGTYDPSLSSESLAALSVRLLEQQKQTWPQLTRGYESLSGVRVREIVCDGFAVRVQFNPGRLVSSSAKVDQQSIAARKCFLCTENLPAEQQGILYGRDTLMLCNPAPIFNEHFTIADIRHLPQSLKERIPLFLALAQDLSPHFTVFYNGPKCGASAPDHMHFQASPTKLMPIETDVEAADRRLIFKQRGAVTILTATGLGRGVLIMESANQNELAHLFAASMDAMQRMSGGEEEPKLNVLCSFQHGAWRIVIFPRTKHRPDVFFEEGERQILISPASVDIGGLIITPREHDFQRVDAALVQNIYREVSVSQEFIETIAEKI
jgi:Domain of unknown function (DUF4922)